MEANPHDRFLFGRHPKVAFVENHDSFSWNVVDCLPVPREAVEITDIHGFLRRPPDVDLLVVGPGPTDPVRAGLVEVILAAAQRRLPVLGICLGHQALGMAFGARLVRGIPAHGKTTLVHFGPSRCFGSFCGPLVAMRYHSLALEEISSPLRVIARLEDGTVMGIEHEELQMAGLQFHPDSHGTPQGRALVSAFFRGLA